MTNTMTSREAFESWWLASKYTQVIYHKDSNHQIAKDAWQASEANQQAEMDALKYDLDGYMKIAHASATEIVQQAQTIANLNAKLEWWRELFPSITPKAAIEYQSVYDKADKAEATIAELVEYAEEVIRISDRKHDAWDKLKESIAKVKGK